MLSWPALYPGTCENCVTRFPAGTEITGVGPGVYVHAEPCPDPLKPRRPVCAACNLEHAGECW